MLLVWKLQCAAALARGGEALTIFLVYTEYAGGDEISNSQVIWFFTIYLKHLLYLNRELEDWIVLVNRIPLRFMSPS